MAVTRSEVLLTLHIVAVVVAFGGALAYPLWFRLMRDATPEQRAFFHRGQANLGKFLITPAILVVFATGAYLASDLDLWGEAWVLIPTGLLALILLLGGAFLGPSEERLTQLAELEERRPYDSLFSRVRLVTWLLAALVMIATFMMVARVPDSGGGGGPSGATPGIVPIVNEAGCLTCHSIGSQGDERPGGDLSTVGAHLSAAEIRRLLVDPPPGMPSYDDLTAGQRDALADYLSGLR